MWFRLYETVTLTLLEHLLPKTGSFLDIGAHIGYFAAFAASRMDTSGRVYAFEPDPLLCKQLTINLRPWPWASSEWAAVGDHDGTSPLWRSPAVEEYGWGTTVYSEESKERTLVHVPSTTLDNWVPRHHGPEPIVVKVDVEGAELRVLRGALDLLRRKATHAVLAEVNRICLGWDGVASADLVLVLKDAGYRLWSYPSSGRGSYDMILSIRAGEAMPKLPVPLAAVA